MANQTNASSSAPRLAIVVGASTGIGRALALGLAAAGWDVVAASRRRETCAALAEEHPELAPRLTARAIDVTDGDGFRETLETVEREQGRIDTLIINAGDYSPMSLSEFDAALFRRLVEVNYLGAVNGIAAALPLMSRHGSGQILVTASLTAYRGLPMAAPYGASKAALLSMLESLKPEADRIGVRLRVINPGFVRTRLTDKNEFRMPQIISPERAADYILREIDGSGFEIFFPKRLGWTLKLLRLLPYRAYFAVTRRMLQR
jgi:NAD(P)-dependent dehydrogenase (short-subunit alcohol dehydrogenase family)